MPPRVDILRKLMVAVHAVTALIVVGASPALAVTASNASSPLGINLSGVSYYSAEQPFMNIFVTNGGWITHGKDIWDTHEEEYLQLDRNGYPRTLAADPSDPHWPQIFDSVGVVLERQGEPYAYPAGKYLVLYDGKGKLTYGFDAKLVSSSPGRDVIEVAKPSDKGIDLRIIRTDSHNHIRDIRLIREGNETAFKAGRLFDPAFLELVKDFRVLRFKDWLSIDGSTLSSWSARPVPSNYTWATPDGVPLEVAIRLANAVSADAWLNVPVMADDDYIKRMAALVHCQLGATQKVYVEYSNEVWNSIYPQYSYAATQGQALWPNRAPGVGKYEWNRNWYGMRTAQMCDIWKSVWGPDRDRVICVLAAQAANTYSAADSLDCPYWTAGAPCSSHGIDAIAIAPYFGDGTASASVQDVTGAAGRLAALFKSLGSAHKSGASPIMDKLSDLATRMRAILAQHHLIEPASDAGVPAGGWFREVSRWETSYVTMLARYHLPLIAYEGGQGFVGGSNVAATTLFIAANRDPRMGTAYTEYLRQWKENGGELFVLYNDVGGFSRFGEWGALESLVQLKESSPKLPPKWRAIQDFIAGDPCWWPACTGIRRENAAAW